jgi:hypothetical protein
MIRYIILALLKQRQKYSEEEISLHPRSGVQLRSTPSKFKVRKRKVNDN